MPRVQQAECALEEGTPPSTAHRRTCPTSTTAAAAKQTAAEAMAPASTHGSMKRHYRSADVPERARNYTNSIVKGFKMTSQSNFFMYLFFCLVLLSSNYAQSLSTSDNVDCTYANSTCSSCALLCLNDEFYPLFPSRCHPSYMVSSHTCTVATVSMGVLILNVPTNLQSSY